jgi:hypothetical protein
VLRLLRGNNHRKLGPPPLSSDSRATG